MALFDSGVLVREIKRDGFATMGRNMHTQNPGKTSSIGAPVFHGEISSKPSRSCSFSSALKMADAVERYAPDIRQTAAAIGSAFEGASDVRAA